MMVEVGVKDGKVAEVDTNWLPFLLFGCPLECAFCLMLGLNLFIWFLQCSSEAGAAKIG